MDAAFELARQPEHVKIARARVRELLRGTPRADDAVAIVSELLVLALAHGEEADETVRIEVGGNITSEDGWCRITVRDRGRARVSQVPDADRLIESSRGLLIIDALADSIGSSTTREGTASWADLRWNASQEAGLPDG